MPATCFLKPSNSLDELARFVTEHKRLFVLTGAGCSTESGIPDYRDMDGEWKHQRPVQYQDFVRSEGVRQRYWARSMLGWPRFAQAKPNAAHRALTSLEAGGIVCQLVTQNVDGLHQKAGSRRVMDLHGRLDTVVCMGCTNRWTRANFQRTLKRENQEFEKVRAADAPDGDAMLDGLDFGRFKIPICPECGGTLKPNVVFFGEAVPPPRVKLALARLREAEALLVVGSSLMVFSGYRFCQEATRQNKPIAAINLGHTRAEEQLTLKIAQRCGQVLPELVRRLGIEHKS